VRRFFFLSLIFCFSTTASAQPYYFRHYQVENGLSNNAVICSIQDKAGFLWAGTKDGLNRFDGYSFKVFRNNPADTTSLGSNFIHSICEDDKGVLWVGTEKGLYRYDAATESFRLIKATTGLQINEITADKNDNLWFNVGLTLHLYHLPSGTLTAFDPANYFESTGICVMPNGAVWASSANGLLKKYNTGSKSFESFDLFTHSKRKQVRWIETIRGTTEGTILVGTASAGVKIFDTKALTYKDADIQVAKGTDVFVRTFLQTSADEFWMGTESGIFIYNTKTGKAVNLSKKYNDPFSLSDNAVYTFCRDIEGGIWAGTYFGGLNYFPKPYTAFQKFYPKNGENSLSGNVVREIKKDGEGNLWIGTEDAGLNKLDAKTGRFVQYRPDGTRSGLSYSNIHGLLLTGNELWIGTFEHGLDVMNIKTGKVVRHYGSGPGSALKTNFIYTIYRSATGEIMLGTTIGLYVYRPANDAFEAIPGLPLYNWYTSIVKDAAGHLWTGTFGHGLHFLNTKTGKSENFRHQAANPNSISSDRINAIYEDKNGQLWFATENGLCRWNPSGRNFIRYGTGDGFPSNFVMSLLEDEKGQLWISTTKGLVCFHPSTKKVQVFTTANGLLSDQLNFSSAFKDENGQMYFGSAKGLVSFQPAAFNANGFRPPIYITGLQVNNKDIVVASQGSPLKKAITFTNSISLAHDQATFSIDFAALSYTAPQMLEYAYKMEGLAPDWTYLKTNRKIYFTELKPGKYTFKVKATNSSGIWNGDERRLIITVRPPWWKSWWAYSLYGLAALLLALLLVRNYHRRMQEKAKRNLELLQIAKDKEIYEAKMEFFTNVAHEIRTPLTLIKGPLEKVIRKAGNIVEIQKSLKIMERNTARLLELTNQLLDFRQTEISGVRLSFVETNISELLDEVYQSFATLAEQREVHFEGSLPATPLYAFIDVEAFTKIIYNLCSNAVKYAGTWAELVLLPAAPDDPTFTVQVKNDGYLIPDSLSEKIFEPFFRIKETDKQKGTGIGLALSRSLAQLHNGSLILEKSGGNRNVFTLALPIHQDFEFSLAGRTKAQATVAATNNKT
jgi:ligand-binding sensor domain-containing protein/signal transduction histidine kinase